MVGGEGGGFGDFFDARHGQVDKVFEHSVGVGVFLERLGGGAFVQCDQ